MIKHEISFKRGGYGEPDQAFVHSLSMPDQIAQFAMGLIQSPGFLTVGANDGEDSAGRAKARPFTPEELAVRCFDIAEATFREIEKRGMMIALPGVEETREKAREISDRN